MSNDIIQLGAGDFDEAMAFLDLVFGEHRPHDFANLLPSVYQPTDEHMRCNYAVREGGRFGAIVGVFPISLRVGDVTLKVAGVGGVSVHPDSRGKGYMNLLMNHAVTEMRREGYDLSYLGGRRQRYAYFGYEVGGCKYKLNFNHGNIRHTLKGSEPTVAFESLPDDVGTLTKIKALHDAQAVCCDRPTEHFDRYLRSWHYQPMLARDAGGAIVGYVAASQDGSQINELVARDPDIACRMIGEWMKRIETNLMLAATGPIGPVLRHLIGIAETASLGPSGNWQVFNWQRVVDALVRVKHADEPMPAGSVSVQIEGVPEVLRVQNIEPGARSGIADMTVSALDAVPLLFGPQAPSSVRPLPEDARMLSAWCPLPLGISPQDKV